MARLSEGLQAGLALLGLFWLADRAKKLLVGNSGASGGHGLGWQGLGLADRDWGAGWAGWRVMGFGWD